MLVADVASSRPAHLSPRLRGAFACLNSVVVRATLGQTDPMDVEVRPLAVSDIPAVRETMIGAYKNSSFYEPAETFAAYLRAFPAGCFAAVADGSLVGYGF